ncbi:hypothetical protein AcV5_002433 [Taiwanofungus camphoratus]|nr:hypothetical protein AcV5_002433 [Antrodia cinnamomea]
MQDKGCTGSPCDALWERHPTQQPMDYLPTLERNKMTYEELYLLDIEVSLHVNNTTQLTKDALAAAIESEATSSTLEALEKEEKWLKFTCSTVREAYAEEGMEMCLLWDAMMERMNDHLKDISKWRVQVSGNEPVQEAVESAAQVSTVKWFNHLLNKINPLLLIFMWIMLVLNVLGHVTCTSCNFTLQMLKALVT